MRRIICLIFFCVNVILVEWNHLVREGQLQPGCGFDDFWVPAFDDQLFTSCTVLAGQHPRRLRADVLA
jgi:hypothetical protein